MAKWTASKLEKLRANVINGDEDEEEVTKGNWTPSKLEKLRGGIIEDMGTRGVPNDTRLYSHEDEQSLQDLANLESTTGIGSASSDAHENAFAKFAEALDKAQSIKNNPFTAFGEIGQSIAKGISLLDPNGDKALLTTEQKVNYANNNIANLSDDNKNKLNEYNSILDELDASRMSLTDNFNPEENERFAENSQRLKDLKASLQQDLNIDDETFNKYVSSSKFLKNLEDRQRQQEEYANASAGEKALANIGDALLAPIRPYTTIKGYLDEKGNPYYDENIGVDHNATGFDLANISRDVTTQATKDIEELTGANEEDANLGNKAANEILKTLYTGVKSGADSMARLATGEVSTLLGAGLEAADQQYVDAGERGLTRAQAIGTAVSSGAAEAVFEKIPVDNMLKLWKNGAEGVAKGGVKAAVKEILQQAGLEGMEEVETDIANKFSDAIINKDKSEFNTQVEEYKAQGMDEAEAFGRTLLDNVADTVESFAGGAIGGLVGGGGAIAGSVATTKEAKKLDGNYREVAQAIPDNVEDYNSEEDYNKAMEVKARAEELDTQDKVSSADRTGLLQDIYAVNETMPEVDLIESINESVNSPFADVGGFQVAKNDITSQEVAQSMSQANNVNDFVEAYRDSQASSNVDARQTGQEYFETLAPKFDTYDEGSRPLDLALTQRSAEDLYTAALNGEEVNQEELNTTKKQQLFQRGMLENTVKQEVEAQRQARREEQKTFEPTQLHNIETPQGKADIADITLDNEGNFKWTKGDEEVIVPRKDISDNAMQRFMVNALNQPTLSAKQLYIDNYDGSIPIGSYNNAYESAFNAGKLNSKNFKGWLGSHKFYAKSIPESTLEAFFNEGAKQVENKSKKVTSAKTKGTGKVTAEKSVENTPIHKLAQAFASRTGIDVEIRDGSILVTDGAQNALTDAEGNEIYSNGQFQADISKVIIGANGKELQTFMHEAIGEVLEAYNPEDMADIQDAILNYLLESKGDNYVDKTIKRYQRLYTAAEGTKSYRDAANEMVNDTLVGLFTTDKGANDFVNWCTKNDKSVLEKITDFIQAIITKLKSLISDANLSSEARTVAEMSEKQAQKIRDRLFKAMDKAIDNYKGAEKGKADTSNRNSIDEQGSIRLSIAGEKALKANLKMRDKAEEMEKKYAKPIEIFKETGWYRGTEGRWKFEISNSEVRFYRNGTANANPVYETEEEREFYNLHKKFKEEGLTKEEDRKYEKAYNKLTKEQQDTIIGDLSSYKTLKDYLYAPTLYKNYPALRDMVLIETTSDKLQGDAVGMVRGDRIWYSEDLSDSDVLETILHEVQHAIQSYEDFDGGASPEYWEEVKNERINNDKEELKKQQSILDEMQSESYNWSDNGDYNAFHNEKFDLQLSDADYDFEDFEWDIDEFKEDLIKSKKNLVSNIESDIERLSELSPYMLYRMTAGEIEARAVESRYKVTQEEGDSFLKGIIPSMSELVATEDSRLMSGAISTSTKNRENKNKARYSLDVDSIETNNNNIFQFDNENLNKEEQTGVFKKVKASRGLPYIWIIAPKYVSNDTWKALAEIEGTDWKNLKDRAVRSNVYYIDNSYTQDFLEYLTGTEVEDNTNLADEKAEEAEETFGTTSSWEDTGYLTTNGLQIDLSVKDSGVSYREDHNSISEIMDSNGVDAVYDFLKLGNIRIIPEVSGIELIEEPNSEQYDKLYDYFAYNNGEARVDLSNDKGGGEGTILYREGTSPQRILSDIENYFETGEVPEGTDDGNVYYSLDTEGNELTEGQQEYFKDSKVRDDQGRLQVLYHGTANRFYVYDNDKIGDNYNGWLQLGNGFYFTDDKKVAKGFAKTAAKKNNKGLFSRNVQSVYLNLVNPYIVGETQEADVYELDERKALTIDRNKLIKLGYDGIIYEPQISSEPNQYVAFNSNQIKEVTNTNPTESEDIRYSLTTDNVREYTLEPNSVHSQYEVSEIWDSEELMDMSDAEEDAKKKQIADLIKDKGILSFEVTQQGKKNTIFVSENTRQGEGKYRATWFDDKGAIMHVARDSAEELAKEILNDLSMTKPINIKAYREGDNDFRYSLDVPTTYALDLEEIFPGSEEATETLKYNKEAFVINMSAANKILDFDISDSQINELAEWLIKAYNSEETEEHIAKNLKGIFEGLKEGYFDDMANALMNLTEETARKAKEVDPDGQARYDSFISGMPKFYFSEEQRREADNMFGGWNAIGGTFANFSSFYRKDAPTLDGSTYWEICDNAQRHGYTMNREVSDLDQITEIKKALEYFEPQSKPMFEGATIEDASLSMAMEIMERYYGYALKENQSNANLSDLKADLRKQVADYKKAVGKQYQEQVKKYQKEIKDLKEKQKYAEQQGQQLYDRVVKAETEGGSTKKISKEQARENFKNFTKAIPKFRLTDEQRKQAIEDMGAWNTVWSRLKYVMNKNAPDLDENIYNKIVDLAKQYGFDGMSKDTDHMGKEIIKALDMVRNQTYQTDNKAVKDLSLANWQLDTDLQQAQRMALRDRNSLSRRIEREKRNKSLNSIKRDINRLIKMAYKPTKNKFIPDILKPNVVEMLNSLDLTVYRKRKDGTIIQSKNESKKVKEWRQNLEALNRLLRDIEDFREVDNKDMYRNDAQRNDIYNLSVSMGNEVNGFLGKFLDKTQGQDVKLTALSSQELEPFEKFLRSFVRSINKAQETYKNLAYKEVEDLANASLNDMSKLRTFSAKGIPKVLHDFLNVSMLDPYTYFEELGDATKTLRDEFVEGTNQKLKRVFQSERAFDKKLEELKLTKKEISKWENNFSEYKGLQLSDTQKMYLYAVFPREQAVAHILVGGVVSDNPNKHNKKYKRNINPTHLTSEDVRKITDTLTNEQKALSDYMVDYLTNTVSEWGNNVSNALYGLDMFTESHYMPIKTDSNTNKTDVGNAKDQANIWSLQNNSATKSLVENANNALVLTDIFDVFSDHIATMAAYEGYVLPINDAMKYYNYSDTQYFKGAETAKRKDLTIKRAIDRVLGEKGKDYFLRFIERVNGDTTNKDDLSGINKLFANNKAQAVLANLRVVIQQPTAYVRALDVIENKYLVKAFSLNPVKLKKYADTSKRKSPLAMYKSKGYYDTSIGQSVRQMITGAYTTNEKINEKAGALAGLADDITWGALYRAAELKIADTTDATKDPDFDKKVLDLFNEIILKTQVVDTVMSKSQLMSNPDGFHRLMTAFMAEPTKTYNMLHRAWMQGHQTKNWKKFRKALVIYAYNQVLVAIAQSIVDAWRDDEDDRPYVDRFLDALFSTTAFSEAETLNDYWKALASANIVDTLNPFNLLPFVKDISSAAQGFDNGNMATQAIYDVVAYIQEIDKLAEGKSTKTPYGFAYKTAQILSVATGVPVASAMREVKDLYNNVNDFWDGENLIRTEKKESKKDKAAKIFEANDSIVDGAKEVYELNLQEQLEKGKSQQDAEKQARSDAKSAITTTYKDKLVDLKENDMSEAVSLRAELVRAYTSLGDTPKQANSKIEKWFK